MTQQDMERCQQEISACPQLEWLRAEHSPGIPSHATVDRFGKLRLTVAIPESYYIVFRDRATGREHCHYHRAGFRRMALRHGWTLGAQTGAQV